MNHWLLFFAQSMHTHLGYVLKKLHTPQRAIHTNHTILTQRQRTILHLLDNPEAIITNKTVQTHCRVSQITASRDLGKLASLLLIAPHGKGRSVSYTRR
jgi:Fic family protein